MAFQLNLKAIEQSQVNTATDRDLLPEGTFAVKVSKCEVKTSNAGHPFFAFEFTVDQMNSNPQCPYIGRRLWNTLMISHPTEVVVQIAHKTLADILIACGIDVDAQIDDIERDLPLLVIDKPLWVRVYNKMDKVKQDLRPEIGSYFGRGEFEGKHRYDSLIQPPKEDETLSGNEALCKKASLLRDDKLLKQAHSHKAKEQSGYSPTPMTDYQKGKTETAFTSFDDVPF